jgi:hypothetical protein
MSTTLIHFGLGSITANLPLRRFGFVAQSRFQPVHTRKTGNILDSEDHVLHEYKNPRSFQILCKTHSLIPLLEMYFPLSFILASLPLLTAAAPLVNEPSSRGIAVPITKRGSPSDGVIDPSKLHSRVRRSVA